MTRRRLILPGIVERVILWLLLISLTLFLSLGDRLWRWDQLVYDAQLRFWTRPAPSDIVLVAIDETSLDTIGRWPWPRSIHARLTERLTAAGARAIAFDVIFAEPSHKDPGADRQLAKALRNNGRVVLPVLVEQARAGGQLIETLPIPLLADAVPSLGHVHVELDPDGIARSVYLLEGLGSPHWAHLGLALLHVAEVPLPHVLPGIRNPDPGSTSPHVWVRDHHMLIPFAGPPGHFPRISYTQVLNGEFPANTFKGKLVLIGVTASGLSDALPTPLSGYGQAMPGVEINANIIDALRLGISIRPLQVTWRVTISVALLLLAAILFTLLTPRAGLIVTALLIVGTFGLSLMLLQVLHVWFPPAATLLTLVISYPLWSWRRLEHAMRFLNRELAVLDAEHASEPSSSTTETKSAFDFLQQVLPIREWSLYRYDGKLLQQFGEHPLTLPVDLQRNHWVHKDDTLWFNTGNPDGVAIIGIHWLADTTPSSEQQHLLDDLVQGYRDASPKQPRGTIEVVEARIQEVQRATTRMRTLRKFVADTVAQMPDGILVVNTLGSIVLGNRHAALYLLENNTAELNGRQLLETLAVLEVQGIAPWVNLVRCVLIDKKPAQMEARSPSGRDLLIQFTPLSKRDTELTGLIINLADISPLKDSERKRAELLGFLSHDLRSPLVSLLALLEISKSKTTVTELEPLLDRMEGYTANTLTLAEQFLQLAHAESGENVSFQETDLVTIAFNSLEQVWAQAENKRIELRHSISIDEAWILADANLLERALINILNNAIKYSPESTVVKLSLHLEQDNYLCCVSDQGPGIAENDKMRIFNRFERLKDDGRSTQRGAGVGLTFVKVVTEQHGGHVQVTSEIGTGSRFCLVLPIR